MSKIQLATIDLAQLDSVTGGRRPDDGGNGTGSLGIGIAGAARAGALIGAGIAGQARLPNRPHPSPGPTPML
jgi:hypothetical protein